MEADEAMKRERTSRSKGKDTPCPAIVMTAGLAPLKQDDAGAALVPVPKMARRRLAAIAVILVVSFSAIAGQLTRLGLRAESTVKLSMAAPLSQHFARRVGEQGRHQHIGCQ